MMVRGLFHSRAWLLWIGLLLLGMVLILMAAGSLEASQAQTTQAVEVGKSVSPLSVLPGELPPPLYTVIFTNTSETDIILDAITDTLPTHFLFVGMHPTSDWDTEPTDPVEPEIVWSGPIAVPANSELSLVYSVYAPYSTPPRPAPYMNTVTAMTTEGTPIGPASAKIWVGEVDLSVTKEAEPTRVINGNPVTYTVEFSNSGHLAGTLATVTDTLDHPLTFLGMLAGSDVITAPAQVGSSLVWTGPFEVPPQQTLTFLYQASTPEGDNWSQPCNRVEADAGDELLGPVETCIVVGPQKSLVYLPVTTHDYEPAWISMTKSVYPEFVPAELGQVVTYTVELANPGDDDSTILTISDTLPTGFRFLEMAPGSDVMDDPDGTMETITWSGPFTMPAGSQMQLVYSVEPSTIEGEYINYVEVAAEGARTPREPVSATVWIIPPILLWEDFDSGIDRWTPFLNYWRLEPGQWHWDPNDGVNGSGALTQDCCIGEKPGEDAVMMYLGEGAEEWTDYRVETQVILRGGGTPLGLWVRGQYEESETRGQWMTGYYIVMGGRPNGATHYVRLLQLQTLTDCWGNACNNPQNLYHFSNPHALKEVNVPGPFERHRWYTLAVEVEGDNIRVYLDDDDVPVIDYVDVKEPFLTGTVGFKTYKAETGSFDNVLVTPLYYVSP
jgi:uncharacterized repeat protein (TIGR01451 family)